MGRVLMAIEGVDGQGRHRQAVVRHVGRVLMVVEDVGGWGEVAEPY